MRRRLRFLRISIILIGWVVAHIRSKLGQFSRISELFWIPLNTSELLFETELTSQQTCSKTGLKPLLVCIVMALNYLFSRCQPAKVHAISITSFCIFPICDFAFKLPILVLGKLGIFLHTVFALFVRNRHKLECGVFRVVRLFWSKRIWPDRRLNSLNLPFNVSLALNFLKSRKRVIF